MGRFPLQNLHQQNSEIIYHLIIGLTSPHPCAFTHTSSFIVCSRTTVIYHRVFINASFCVHHFDHPLTCINIYSTIYCYSTLTSSPLHIDFPYILYFLYFPTHLCYFLTLPPPTSDLVILYNLSHAPVVPKPNCCSLRFAI